MDKFSFTFTKRNFVFLTICLGGLTFLVLVSILPLIAQKHELTAQVPILKNQLSVQQQTAEIIATIDKKLKKLDQLESLPKVSNNSLKITESVIVTNDIEELAQQQQLDLVNFQAKMPKSAINLKTISFMSTVTGSLNNLRGYMFALLQIPYVGGIKKIEIESGDNVLIMELTFTVRLS